MLIVMAGLPASGKSAVSQALKQTLNAVLLDKDQLRACIFADLVDYTREQDDLCVDMMYDVAQYHLTKRPDTPVILDGRTYSRRYQVDSVKRAAQRADTPMCIIECICTPETARARLRQDKNKHVAKNRNELLYEKSRAAAEQITDPRLVLDTEQMTKEQCVQSALDYIRKLQR